MRTSPMARDTYPSYRLNPRRAVPPRILAAPRFHALLTGRAASSERVREGLRRCLDSLRTLYPTVSDHWGSGGCQFDGPFEITMIWSERPGQPDVFLLLGPGDHGFTYWRLAADFERTRDERLLAGLSPLPLESVA